jgi:two-component system, sensor histidine kinase
LQRSEISPEQFKLVRNMMDRQLTQLVKLIDDLLDVSRISTGKVVLKRERLDLRQVVETAIETCQPVLDAARHQLALSLPDHELTVVGDAVRLAQSISNLINNASKYTASGGRISVRVSDEGAEAVVVVTDTGAGIPPAMLDRVFEMFAQVDRTLERAQGGLGIGLSLVKRLILLHGGQVSVRSAGIDRGSEFTLRLPRISTPAAAPAVDSTPPPPVPTRPLRVMVVDDNRDAADSLAMLLQALGHQTQVEYSGQAVLDTARSFRPQAVFCDIGMPGFDGLDVATMLREDRRFASTVLVAVTGWGAEEDMRRSRHAGFDFHLTKPASAEAIKNILVRL